MSGNGQGGRQDGGQGRRGGRRRGERTVVPRAEFTSYYGRPVLNTPAWKPLDIGGYFFLGGLAGAGSVLAAGARLTGRPGMTRALKVSSTLSIAGSAAALVHDLGRPARFANMLRVIKPTSPMSMGSWLLAGYGPLAGAAAVSDLTGVLPRAGDAATAGAALLGPAVATYTAVLAADTAVPAWHDAHRELPFVFAGSATCAAAGMALMCAPVRENAPARHAALFGAALEAVATRAMKRRLGMVAETYEEGKAGRLMTAASLLTAGGALAGAASGVLGGAPGGSAAVRRCGRTAALSRGTALSRAAAALSGAVLLAGSLCTRLGVFHAGRAALADPKYTVVPQRERLRARQEAAEAASEPDSPGPPGDQRRSEVPRS